MIAKALDTGVYPDFEHRIVRPDGTHRYLLAKGAVTRGADGSFAKIIGGCLDITERREAEERQRQSQKLEAIGQLSAGIAHNFNNLLMAILPNLDLAMVGANAETRELLEAAQGAALRAAELVRQLTTFAGRARPAPRRPEDIREVVERTMAICRRAFDREIELNVTLPAEPAFVVGDPTLLEQALLNILINARDALTEAQVEAPCVRIEVARISASADEIRSARAVVARRRRVRSNHRQRSRNECADSAPNLRAVLHDQGRGQGDGAGSLDLARHREGSRRND